MSRVNNLDIKFEELTRQNVNDRIMQYYSVVGLSAQNCNCNCNCSGNCNCNCNCNCSSNCSSNCTIPRADNCAINCSSNCYA